MRVVRALFWLICVAIEGGAWWHSQGFNWLMLFVLPAVYVLPWLLLPAAKATGEFGEFAITYFEGGGV